MATTDVTASLQGIVSKIGFGTTWSAMRNATSGDSATTYTSATNVGGAISAEFESGRFGSFGGIARTYLFFDIEDAGVTTNITGLSLKVPGVSNNSSSVIPIEGTAWGGSGGTTTLTNAMFNDLNFNRAYATSTSNWSTSGYNTFSLNNNAISDANSDGYLNVVLLNASNDYPNVSPFALSVSAGVRFKNNSQPIELVVTHADAGYGNEVNGVSGANINRVIAVPKANIARVIGVP
tara:strand:+ start:2515 stop:3222 length:708 start_codon:yes stop_codon:yes gene_type:complete